MKVYGMGEKKTPQPFIMACDKFIYIEVIRAAGREAMAAEGAKSAPESAPAPGPKAEPEGAKKPARKGNRKKPEPESAPAPEPTPEPPSPAAPPEEPRRVPREVVDLIADSLESIADEDGYAFMGELGNLLMKKQPDFDPRNFGFSKLTQLVKSLDRFEVDARQTSAPHVKHIYLRDKQRK